MNGKKILITGASGFIGSTAVDRALGLGFETWAGIRKSSSRTYLQDDRIRFIDLPYHDKEQLRERLRLFVDQHGSFDYILHIAGATQALHEADFYRVNYQYTRHLVDVLIEEGIQPDAFVLMSTLGVLGVGDEVSYTPFQADHAPNPNTAYGRSKLQAEIYLKGLDNFPYLILRPTGVYGPRDRDYLILMKAVKSGLNVGAGFKEQRLSFIYSEDLVEIIFTLLKKGITRKEFLVSDGDSYTDSEFNAIVQETLQRKRVLRVKVPLWIVKSAAFLSEKWAALFGKTTTFNSDKYSIMKQRNWTCDITPLREAIGFTPTHQLREGIAKTVAWYKEHGWL